MKKEEQQEREDCMTMGQGWSKSWLQSQLEQNRKRIQLRLVGQQGPACIEELGVPT